MENHEEKSHEEKSHEEKSIEIPQDEEIDHLDEDPLLDSLHFQIYNEEGQFEESTLDLRAEGSEIVIGSNPENPGTALVVNRDGIADCHASIGWEEGKLYLYNKGENELFWQEQLVDTKVEIEPEGIFYLGRDSEKIPVHYKAASVMPKLPFAKNQIIDVTQTEVMLGRLFLEVIDSSNTYDIFTIMFTLRKNIVYIGRNPELCGKHGVVLDEDGISGKHAAIYCEDNGELKIQDEGATNGTFVNGERIEANASASLPQDAQIRIGPITLQCSSLYPQNRQSSKKVKPEEDTTSGVVIAEFILTNLDSPNAAANHCEIFSNKPYYTIGRSHSCDYPIKYKEKYVAEEQASIVYSVQEESYIIRCLAKENPITVEGQRVKGDTLLKPGSVIKLGIATNAPKIRFSVEGHSEIVRDEERLSVLLPVLKRGKTYTIGDSKNSDIKLSDPTACATVIQMTVPMDGNHLVLTKDPNASIKVMIDGGEVHAEESRILHHHKTLDIGHSFSIIHDHDDFQTPRIPKKCVLSDFLPAPERSSVYPIGSGDNSLFRVEDTSVPHTIAELEVPAEGEHFIVRKIAEGEPVTIDNNPVPIDSYNGMAFGVNQVLCLGDHWEIRNNHRSLPSPVSTSWWKLVVKAVSLCLLLAGLVLGAIYLIDNYSTKIKQIFSPQSALKLYKKNVFYIAMFDENLQLTSSGTGFLMPKQDTYGKDIYYIVTCKHVIESWKFSKHKNDMEAPKSYIALWPYDSKAIDMDKKQFHFATSFNNLPKEYEKMGTVRVHKVAEDDDIAEGGFVVHKKRSNGDLAVLQVVPEDKNWKYSYHKWGITSKQLAEAGEEVIAVGYSLGEGRLLHKNGLTEPVTAEGKLSSKCQAPDFIELDINQTQGSSGGPIIDKNGDVLGVISFSNKGNNWVYGIHAQVLKELMR